VLPSSVGNLLELRQMHLYRNKLTILPLTIGRLTNLEVLDVSDNHTTSPPVETVALGTKAIISFFQHLLQVC
jgi:Leucine-rich repeat (LRR) protein